MQSHSVQSAGSNNHPLHKKPLNAKAEPRATISTSSPPPPSEITNSSSTSSSAKDANIVRLDRACVACRAVHAACDSGRPCRRCSAEGRAQSCRDAPSGKKRGRPRKADQKQPAIPSANSSISSPVNSSPSPSSPVSSDDGSDSRAGRPPKRARIADNEQPSTRNNAAPTPQPAQSRTQGHQPPISPAYPSRLPAPIPIAPVPRVGTTLPPLPSAYTQPHSMRVPPVAPVPLVPPVPPSPQPPDNPLAEMFAAAGGKVITDLLGQILNELREMRREHNVLSDRLTAFTQCAAHNHPQPQQQQQQQQQQHQQYQQPQQQQQIHQPHPLQQSRPQQYQHFHGSENDIYTSSDSIDDDDPLKPINTMAGQPPVTPTLFYDDDVIALPQTPLTLNSVPSLFPLSPPISSSMALQALAAPPRHLLTETTKPICIALRPPSGTPSTEWDRRYSHLLPAGWRGPVVISSNTAFCSLSRYSMQELHGMSIMQLFADVEQASIQILPYAFSTSASDASSVFSWTFNTRRKDGSRVIVRSSNQVFYNDKGEYEWCITVVDDWMEDRGAPRATFTQLEPGSPEQQDPQQRFSS